jgi:hypothetical protein
MVVQEDLGPAYVETGSGKIEAAQIVDIDTDIATGAHQAKELSDLRYQRQLAHVELNDLLSAGPPCRYFPLGENSYTSKWRRQGS